MSSRKRGKFYLSNFFLIKWLRVLTFLFFFINGFNKLVKYFERNGLVIFSVECHFVMDDFGPRVHPILLEFQPQYLEHERTAHVPNIILAFFYKPNRPFAKPYSSSVYDTKSHILKINAIFKFCIEYRLFPSGINCEANLKKLSFIN